MGEPLDVKFSVECECGHGHVNRGGAETQSLRKTNSTPTIND